ncbi:hypothetical protein BT93_F3003 [Corymbia citriodora subsp. variegata]|nr:hypothetical protein BT93_F3003 [Corymbia citriodora subsp. variegata]
MEGCSRAVESLDSLWLFSNVLSRSRPLPPAAEAEETEEKEGEGEEPVKNQASGPEEEAARAKPLGATTSSTKEAVGTPGSAEEESKLKERMGRSKRRQRRKRMFHERRRRENRFLVDRRRRPGLGVASGVRAMQKMPPLSDGIAMREHLRSWAIAVACAVK